MKRRSPPLLRVSRSLGGGLGFFRECDAWCPEGLERVTVKKNADGIPTVCVCRLDAKTRKKNRDETAKITRDYQEKLKPFGKWKAPKHLRRCVTMEMRRGKMVCVDTGLPSIKLEPIRR